MKQNDRIGWIAIGNKNTGSTRIGVLNIHEGLIANRYSSTIISTNKVFGADIDLPEEEIKRRINDSKITKLIFQKVFSEKTQRIVKWCKEQNIKTVYACGDWHETPMWEIVDAVVVGSPYVKNYLLNEKNIKNVHYIDDALEIDLLCPIKNHTEKNTLTIGWYGNYMKVASLGNFYKELNIENSEMFIISNTPKNWPHQANCAMGDGLDIPWSTDNLVKILLDKVDVVIIPTEQGAPELKTNAKTANRLTLSMALGIPVVAYPISSYIPLIDQGVNGFLCDSVKKWREALTYLKKSKNREAIGFADVSKIRENFNVKNIIKGWLAV